jgi:type I restriction enzyme R subunit
MPTPCEYTLAEKPCIEGLQALGYSWLPPSKNELARDGLNQVLLRDEFVTAISEINCIDEETARTVYLDMLNITDNQKWLSLLRSNYSRHIPGSSTKQTIHLIDFQNVSRNRFTVTNQLFVKAQNSRKPDVVVYVNGIPLIVIEAKSPVTAGDKASQGFEQIKQYERDIPRLFYSNLFSVITDGVRTLFGTTGAPSEFWSAWKDSWPRRDEDFRSELDRALYCLLEPSRLLDILAHFIVFETRSGKTIKKMCRYQQYRAVNKIVQRIVDKKHRRGLIWHTQGSGKSLTMVFAALKLKSHRTITDPALASPNILVLTDRIDLDVQISKTFAACGIPNPRQMQSVKDLHSYVHSGTVGLTLLSTIFKFDGSRKPVENSSNWIVLVDECHRTQEKDLGAYLRATLPDAWFFGFTGTPIKKNDFNTYANFGVQGEGYLDKYSIDDAVADGATVPVRYTSRKAEWQVDEKHLDMQFDNWFSNLSVEKLEELKQKGVTVSILAKHPKRIKTISEDIWTHYQAQVAPDGYKAQIVAIDREAIILYKRALDKTISEDLIRKGMTPVEAEETAANMSAPVYSTNQEDGKPSEDIWTNSIRDDLNRYKVEGQAEKDVIAQFTDPSGDLKFLIVCNKLLTGFDAPVENTMYLDSPLKDHNLLQAIARTNRVYGDHKDFGLIVDYIGVTRYLKEALSSYHEPDIANAMVDIQAEREKLATAYSELSKLTSPVRMNSGNIKNEMDAMLRLLEGEDDWFSFKGKATAFLKAYESLSPDPFVLNYTDYMKWIAAFMAYGKLRFEPGEDFDLRKYSLKVREMLREYLEVSGMITLVKLRTLAELQPQTIIPAELEDLNTAAIRRGSELTKVLRDKTAENPLRYEKFSSRVWEILHQLEARQIDAAGALGELDSVLVGVREEEQAYRTSGMNERAYGVYRLLQEFLDRDETSEASSETNEDSEHTDISLADWIRELAEQIDLLYSSDEEAPVGWHLKSELKKHLRQKVRLMARDAGLHEARKLMPLPHKVEEFALRFYVKVA